MTKPYKARFDPRRPLPRRERMETIYFGGWKVEVLLRIEEEGELTNTTADVILATPEGVDSPTSPRQDAKDYAIREALKRASNYYPPAGSAE